MGYMIAGAWICVLGVMVLVQQGTDRISGGSYMLIFFWMLWGAGMFIRGAAQRPRSPDDNPPNGKG